MAEGGLNEHGDLCEFSKKTKHNDVKFLVESQDVYASRAVLCVASPVFDEMFEDNPTQAVELPGVKIEHFKQFLKCIYPHILNEINEETVYLVLPFAHKYKVKILRERCVKMILEIVKRRYVQNAQELYRHIKLAELYEVQELEELCVDMASECTLTEMEEANTNHPISPETDLKIMRIGHRKLEMFKQDAEFCRKFIKKDDLKSKVDGLLNPKLYLKSTDPVWKSFTAYKYFKEETKFKNYAQASRLVLEHFKDNQELRNDALSKLSSIDELTDEQTNEDLELFKLLHHDWSASSIDEQTNEQLFKLLPHDLKMELEEIKYSQ